MKLTDEQKAHNSAIKTGVGVLRHKIARVYDKIVECQEVITLNQDRSTLELHRSRVVCAESDIKMRQFLIKHLEKCIETLQDDMYTGTH